MLQKVMDFISMNYMKLFFLLIFFTLCDAKPIIIDSHTKEINLLSQSEIYIDHSRKLTIEQIKNSNIAFEKNEKNLLGFGYSPNFDVWIRFTLYNNTNKNIERILEYANALTTDILFFDEKNSVKDGLFHAENRNTINPIFNISLNANESKTYYVKASSYITSLIVKLNLLDTSHFYSKEIQHQFILALFFGAMIILGLYNLFIYFFTKDISYLYYVLYLVGIIVHHLMYVGISSIYLLNSQWMHYAVSSASIFIAFPIFALALFSKSFLRTQQYPKINIGINIFLLLIPISVIIFLSTDQFNKYRNILSLCLIIYLILITTYATLKKNRQAYFILFGWFIVSLSIVFMYLSSTGIFSIYKYFSYIVEVCLVMEAIIFSIALADRINQLQKDKALANERLIVQQQDEQKRLAVQVEEKTQDLKIALDEKGLLLKELNHRVKNNMQTIVSLVRLQSDEVEDERSKNIFITIQNRLNAMSHLHELLYTQDNISHVNAYEYFDILIEELKESYTNEVNINFDINTNLKMEEAIYCGLILNELVSNSFKYAFEEGKGEIDIQLKKIENQFHLNIKDNGIGYIQSAPTNSLGLILVDTLAKHQLKGKIEIDSSNGVSVQITWSDHG